MTDPVASRLDQWRRARDYLAIGNLGEHVTGHLLVDLGYYLLGAQDDYLGMVPEVLGQPTRAHPEDFNAVDPDGRLVTVNAKATVSSNTCRVLPSGDLSAPRISRRQREVQYSTLRANLASPLEGGAFGQVVKVDLMHLRAQIFDIAEDSTLRRLGPPHDVTEIVVAVLDQFPDHLPPPNVNDLN